MRSRYDSMIDRRTFLRGVGTAMALPMLEAMIPTKVLASAAAKVRTNRMAFVFIPNGVHMKDWRPATEGAFDLPYILQPLQKVKDSVSVYSGLSQHNAFALQDGAGDHARSVAAWLTGCHPRKTAGADIKNGISVDQLAAQSVGHYTKFASLEIGCERGAMAGNCDSGYSCAYSSSISWRGDATPVAKEVNPRLVFERLFAGSDPNETAEMKAKKALYRKSILDFVSEDATRLKSQLGMHDQRKVDEYFAGVREIEERLARVEKANNDAAALAVSPKGIPSDYGEHLRLMADMMILAFQSDLTRIATFMFANDGSNRPYKMIDIAEGHHDLSHHESKPEKQAKLREINHFHVSNLAYMLEKMQSIQEPEGTLLDNSMVVYGAGISDGNRHNHDDLPILLAGKGAGTIKSGRHVKYDNNTPMTNLFLSMLDRMGVNADHIGDSTGKLQRLI
ncbi:MAG: DUF1552 domain-containing protein [Chthonomonadales bacterium]